MEVQLHQSLALLCNAVRTLAYALSFRYTLFNGSVLTLSSQFNALYDSLIQTVHIFHSETYCRCIDYVQIAYYPVRIRVTNQNIGARFPPMVRKTINDLEHVESFQLTGLSQNQLMILFIHLRIPDTWCYMDRHRFTGEESFLHFMVYLRIEETKLRMSTNYFGGRSAPIQLFDSFNDRPYICNLLSQKKW